MDKNEFHELVKSISQHLPGKWEITRDDESVYNRETLTNEKGERLSIVGDGYRNAQK